MCRVCFRLFAVSHSLCAPTCPVHHPYARTLCLPGPSILPACGGAAGGRWPWTKTNDGGENADDSCKALWRSASFPKEQPCIPMSGPRGVVIRDNRVAPASRGKLCGASFLPLRPDLGGAVPISLCREILRALLQKLALSELTAASQASQGACRAVVRSFRGCMLEMKA